MIILLLVLAYSISEASADNVHRLNVERPDVDIVRQLDYVQRMSKNQAGNVYVYDVNEAENRSEDKTKRVNVSNGMSANRINSVRIYISGKAVGLCDFTCHTCYRCSLVYGK